MFHILKSVLDFEYEYFRSLEFLVRPNFWFIIIFGSHEFWFFFGLPAYLVYRHFWFTIIFGSPIFWFHNYFFFLHFSSTFSFFFVLFVFLFSAPFPFYNLHVPFYFIFSLSIIFGSTRKN